MGLEYLLFKTGPLTMPPSQLGAFARSDPSQPSANIEWHVQPLSLDKFGDPLHAFPAITPSVCNLRPTSRGHVRIKSADPLAHPGDQAQLSRDGRRSQGGDRLDALHAPDHGGAGARASIGRRNSSRALAMDPTKSCCSAAGDLGTTIFHPVGTCKMGQRRAGGGGRSPARARHRRPARDRRVDHAAHHLGQHQCADGDDRGAGRGDDPGRPRRYSSPRRHGGHRGTASMQKRTRGLQDSPAAHPHAETCRSPTPPTLSRRIFSVPLCPLCLCVEV